MKLDKLRFKNFAIYGSEIQELDFNNENAEFYLTLGKNGEGKSTIANAIVFALYGKVEGARLNDLPNRINKNLWVEIKLWCGNMYVEIERGLQPTKFKVLINGSEFDKAGKKSVQDYLEEEVYGIPYHVFKNIIILSVNDFKSFLSMSNSDKKQIIDKMFGFSILNEMEQLAKDEHKSIKSQIDAYENEINQIYESIKSTREQLNSLQSQANEKNKQKINELKSKLSKLNDQLKSYNKDFNELNESIKKKQNNIEERKNNVNKLNYQADNLNNKLNLYDKGYCPTCETKLDTQWHKEKREEFKNQIEDYNIRIGELQKEIKDIQQNVNNLNNNKKDITNSINNLKQQMQSMKDELTKIKNSSDSSETEYLNKLITEFEEKQKQKTSEKNNLAADKNFISMVESTLGEGGIKNLATKTILPNLNSNIAAMAQTMHLPFHIKFNEKFDCIIHHLGEQINPMTLSTGERKKVDFIIIIAIIKVLKLRFPQLNLLFLDELLSSVDHDGIHNMLKILNQVIKEQNLNTFVINHTTLPRELFDKEIYIYRENGFSKFEINNVE